MPPPNLAQWPGAGGNARGDKAANSGPDHTGTAATAVTGPQSQRTRGTTSARIQRVSDLLRRFARKQADHHWEKGYESCLPEQGGSTSPTTTSLVCTTGLPDTPGHHVLPCSWSNGAATHQDPATLTGGRRQCTSQRSGKKLGAEGSVMCIVTDPGIVSKRTVR